MTSIYIFHVSLVALFTGLFWLWEFFLFSTFVFSQYSSCGALLLFINLSFICSMRMELNTPFYNEEDRISSLSEIS